MNPIEGFKYLGLYTISLAWIALSVLLLKWPRDKTLSFSQHMARNPRAMLMMAVIESIALPVFIIFIVFWFVPTYHPTAIFTALNLTAATGFMVAAWVPAVNGLKGKIHDTVSYGAAITLIPASIIMILTGSISSSGRLVSLFAVIYMITSVAAYKYMPKARDHYLLFQAAYILTYHLAILTSAYIR